MQISYQPLWNLLETKKMKKKDLMKIADMSANCTPNEVIEFRPDKKEGEIDEK